MTAEPYRIGQRPKQVVTEASRRNSRAQSRALSKLVAAHPAEYAALYQQHERNQGKARRLLTYRYPDEYRALYLLAKVAPS